MGVKLDISWVTAVYHDVTGSFARDSIVIFLDGNTICLNGENLKLTLQFL